MVLVPLTKEILPLTELIVSVKLAAGIVIFAAVAVPSPVTFAKHWSTLLPHTLVNVSEVALVANPTVTSSGLLLGEWAFGIDSKKGAVGGAGERSTEIILNPGSKYMWSIEATAGSVIINEDGYWYENGA